MNIKILASCCLAMVAGTTLSQSIPKGSRIEEFREEQLRKIEQFNEVKTNEMAAFRDSINKAYATFLEQKWESFNLYRDECGFLPMPEPPVYDPTVPPVPDDKPQPVADLPIEPPMPVDTLPAPADVPPRQEIVEPPRPSLAEAEFFGTKIEVQQCEEAGQIHLAGVSEQAVADFWRRLSALPIETLVSDMCRVRDMLQLNDWGMLQLSRSLAGTYISMPSENERVVFSVFMLGQLGLSAKIGRSGSDLYVLLATRSKLSNTSYFTFHGGNDTGNKKYYVINPNHKQLSNIQTCNAQFGDGGRTADLSMRALPEFARDAASQRLNFDGETYDVDYNRNLVEYFATYPCTDFAIYATAPLDKQMLESLKHQLHPRLAGKSQREVVNYLLHFVQNAFRYKTDTDQFGYEKWNFAEETLVSAYCDCDDRAVFFAQLVRNLLDMEVVLVHYPGVHLATAVYFDEEEVPGTYVTTDGRKFMVCDPTYINANIGMAMPDLRNTPVEVIKLN